VPAHILIVEDEQDVREIITTTLSTAGYQYHETGSGKAAVRLAESRDFDLILLDILLPEIDGFEVYEQIKKFKSIPVIYLTALMNEEDKVRGLSQGAEDYMVKPFYPKELLLRIEKVLRRFSNQEKILSAGGVQLDLQKHEAYMDGAKVDLMPQELKLLTYLMRNPRVTLTREQILEMVWGMDYEGGSRTVDIHIQQLRKKLSWENRISTVYKLGYRLDAGD
jgi:two-component system alkaline phosphatase synthesis response regulator PhoP